MAIPAELESLSSNDPDGSIWKGCHREVLSNMNAGTTETQLTAKQSGALVLLNDATGHVIRLPTPVAGMWFEFLATVAVTSNEYKVITKTVASEFLIGAVISGNLTVASSGDVFQADGTSHVSINENGSTTGGLIGDTFKVVAISTTQWAIEGRQVGSGTNADPFDTT
jgi:hypothetical protein